MSKYNAKKKTIDGIKFASQVEGKYYLYLKDLKEQGKIKDFELQPKFEILPKFKDWEGNNIRAINYIADFRVINNDDTVEIIDIKGMATTDAKMKRKMFMYRYPELPLKWIVYVVKRGGWLCYFENERLKRKEKRDKKKAK